MPEAAEAMLDFGLGTLGLHRVWADGDPRNVGTARALRKLGFRLEAHVRENVFLWGGQRVGASELIAQLRDALLRFGASRS